VALNDLVDRCVVPYYLKMMNRNAVEYGADLVDEIATVGRSITDEDVETLLRSDWRPRVMGAWFSPVHDVQPVRSALLKSLETAGGYLTAPPLAAAAAALSGEGALDSLRIYRAADIAGAWGGASFIDATIEFLGSQPEPGSETSLARPEDHEHLSELLRLVDRLRGA
jgi:hypothetical protein